MSLKGTFRPHRAPMRVRAENNENNCLDREENGFEGCLTLEVVLFVHKTVQKLLHHFWG